VAAWTASAFLVERVCVRGADHLHDEVVRPPSFGDHLVDPFVEKGRRMTTLPEPSASAEGRWRHGLESEHLVDDEVVKSASSSVTAAWL
jgi:hypothetical protein